MSLSNRQKQEVDFFVKFFEAKPTEQEVEEYFNWTVKGIKPLVGDKRSENSLFQAKRRLDINVAMWTEDMQKGLLAHWELEEDFDHPYFRRLLKSIRKKITPLPSYDGLLSYASLGFLNSKYTL